MKSEGMSVVDENGDTTFQVLANGKVTATEAQIDNVTIGGTDDSTAINVSDGKFVVYDGGAFQAAGRNFIVNGQGEMTAAAATVDNVVINDDKVTGLSNTIWTGNKGDVVSGRAATEDQLMTVQTDVTTLENKTAHIKHVTEPEGTDYTTVEGTKFNSDGSISAVAKDNRGFGTASLDFNADGVSIKEESFGATSSTTISGDKITATDASDNQTIIDGGSVTTEQLTVNGNLDNKLTFGERGLNINSGDTNVNVSEDGISLNVDNGEGLNNSVKISQDSTTFSYSESGAAGATTTVIKGNTITAGDVVIDGAAGKATITGLSNTEWSGKVEDLVADRAATEGQLMTIYDNVRHIKHVGVDGTHYTLVEKTKFNDDGSVETMGTVKAADATFKEGSHELVTAGQLYAAGIVPGKVESKDGTPVFNSIALGEGSKAIASQATALGSKSSATAAATAVGEEAKATGIHSTALGYQSMATKESATALGYHAQALHDNSIALGANSITDRDNSISVGSEGNERQITNVAAGTERTDAANVGQLEDFQVQVGETIGTADFSRTNYVRGAENVTEAIYAVDRQVKVNSDALDAYEAAGIVAGNKVGQYSKAIALGNNATAGGWSAVAIGSNAEAEDSNSVAIGVDSASGALSTAVGAGSKADGTQATALGQNSKALGQGTVSLGANTKADGEGAVSIGFNNSAEAAGSVAIGNGAHVYESGTNSVALGQWSTTSDEKVVSVGNDWLKRRITNVADGIDPTDAVNVQQLTDRTANMVEWDEGTKDTIHGVTLNGGTISAADGKFNVWSSGGVKATYGNFNTSIEAAGGNFKVNGTTGGITTAGGIKANGGITAANDNFNVWNSGGMKAAYGVFEGKITAAGEKFIVDGNGNITTAGQITAANNNFHVWGTGGIAIGADTANPLFAVNGNNGDVTTQGEIVAKGMYVGSKDADNAVVTKGDMTDVVGDADFSDTNYAAEAGNVTEAIYDVDEQVKSNSDVLAGYEVAGITSGTNTDGTNSIAIGEYSGNVGSYSVAVGVGAGTSDSYNVAIGAHAQVTGANSVALGYGSYADEDNVVSVGKYGDYRRIVNVADGVNEHDAVNVGQLDEVKSSISIVDNDLAEYKAAGVVPGAAVPDEAEGAMALGTGAEVRGDSDKAMAIGNGAGAASENAVAVGASAQAIGSNSLALGPNARTALEAHNGVAIGSWAKATEDNAIAIGQSAGAKAENAVAVGMKAKANSDDSIAIGTSSNVAEGGIKGIALGAGATIKDNGGEAFENGIAVGTNATVSRNNAIAIGMSSNSDGQNSVALGSWASATGYNSVALGFGSKATANNVISVGDVGYERKIVNVAKGEDNYDAVNVAQLNSTVANATKDVVSWDPNVEDTIQGVTLKSGKITAADGKFHVWSSGGIAIGEKDQADGYWFAVDGSNGDVSTRGNITANGTITTISDSGDATIEGNRVTLTKKNPNGDQNKLTVIDPSRIVVGQVTGDLNSGIHIVNNSSNDRTITGLTNTSWGTDPVVANRAATEGQLAAATKDIADIQTQVTDNTNDIANLNAKFTDAGINKNSLEKAVAVANQLDGANLSALNTLSQIAPMSLNVPTMMNALPPENAQEATGNLRDPNEWGNNTTDGTTTTIDTDLKVTGDASFDKDVSIGGKLEVAGGASIDGGNLEMNNNKITGVADGTDAHDAVNFGQLDKVQQQVTANTENIGRLGSAVNKLDNRIDEVGAGAAALAALHPLDFDPDNKWDFSAGYGNYRGESAVAFGAFYRPNEDTMFSVGGTVGNDDNMVNAGVSIKIGSGSSGVTTSRVAMAKEIKAMRDVVAKQDAQIQKLTAMVNALVGVEAEPDTTTMFPDVPENHWAYEAVAAMARSGLVKGYPDGEFKGDRTMTRYEFAQIIQNAIQAGAEVDSRLVEEFKPELEYFHIAAVAKDKDGNPTIERVRAN